MNKFYLYFKPHNEDRYPKLRELIDKHLFTVNTIEDADYILVAGGDGSLLDAIQNHYEAEKPFIGINAGSLGHYMNPYESEMDVLALKNVVFELIELPMLKYEVESVDGVFYNGRAFADLWIKAKRTSMIYNICIDDNIVNYCSMPEEPIYGDGILFSNPVGTTGYAHNLGGTVIPYNLPIYQVLPMASSITKKKLNPFPVSLDTKVSVHFEQADYRSGELFFDGFCLNDIDGFENFKPKNLIVEKSSKKVSIGFISLSEFRAKLFKWLY